MEPDTFKKNDLILFQGDSITDCGRRNSPTQMGGGYAFMISSLLQAQFPELDLRFVNRGISGNKCIDMSARWQEDCLDLKPNLISIMIGINDTWRRYDSNDPTPVESFRDTYHRILSKTRKTLDATIVLCEPFLLPVPEDRKRWREDLDPKITVVRELAREFGAHLVPLDGIFAWASSRKACEYWAPDGVHPSAAGHELIAQNWLKFALD